MLQEWLHGVRAVPSKLQEGRERLMTGLADAPTKLASTTDTAAAWARDSLGKAVESGEQQLHNASFVAMDAARGLLQSAPLPDPVAAQATTVVDTLQSNLLAAPMANYDTLGVRPVLRNLHSLDDVALARLDRYERANKARKTLLDAIGKEQARRV